MTRIEGACAFYKRIITCTNHAPQVGRVMTRIEGALSDSRRVLTRTIEASSTYRVIQIR